MGRKKEWWHLCWQKRSETEPRKIWAWNSSTGFLSEAERAGRGENRGGKSSGRRSWLGVALFNHGCWEFHTLTLVQLVLLHDVVLQLGAHVLLLLLDWGGLPAVFFIHFPSNAKSSSTPSGSSVWVHVVAHDGGLDELGGGVRRWLAPWTHKAPFFQVWAVEGLHLIDLVGQVYISIDSWLWHNEIGLLVFHLVVIIGDAVGWRTWAGYLINLVYCWSVWQQYASSLKALKQ